jgi:hypothetical protein
MEDLSPKVVLKNLLRLDPRKFSLEDDGEKFVLKTSSSDITKYIISFYKKTNVIFFTISKNVQTFSYMIIEQDIAKKIRTLIDTIELSVLATIELSVLATSLCEILDILDENDKAEESSMKICEACGSPIDVTTYTKNG